MRLEKLELADWRNIAQAAVCFGPGINYVCGMNGSGKTNLLEAAAYLAYARSFRKSQDRELVKTGQKATSVKGLFAYDGDAYTKTVEALLKGGSKQIAVDGKKAPTLSSFVGTVLISVFDPRNVFLFRGEPSERRKAIDETLSAINPKYLYSLQRYKKLLRERNQALAQKADGEVLGVLANELITAAYRIVQERLSLAAFANKVAGEYFAALFGGSEPLTLTYRTNSSLESDPAAFRKDMLYRFERHKSQEMIRRATVIGPHLDDLAGYLAGKSLAGYGSQGQNRLASLSLTLALAKMMKEKKGETPILILDDVLSDLDSEKKRRLTETVAGLGQSIISGSVEDRPPQARAIRVENGVVAEEKERDN